MQFNNKIALALGISIFMLGTATRRDPKNPPLANTGAPNETTCAKSGCHNGGSFTGTVELTGLPDTIQFNTSYTLTLTNKSNAVRAGFQLTALDGSNVKCGTLTAGTGVNVATMNSIARQYARQSDYKTLSAGSTSWTFTWKSPATAASNKATFYFTSLCGNGNGKETLDNVLQGTKTVFFKQSVAANEPTWASEIKVFPTTTDREITVALPENSEFEAQVFSASGQLVAQQVFSKNLETVEVADWQSGIYFLKISRNGEQVTRRFVVR